MESLSCDLAVLGTIPDFWLNFTSYVIYGHNLITPQKSILCAPSGIPLTWKHGKVREKNCGPDQVREFCSKSQVNLKKNPIAMKMCCYFSRLSIMFDTVFTNMKVHMSIYMNVLLFSRVTSAAFKLDTIHISYEMSYFRHWD